MASQLTALSRRRKGDLRQLKIYSRKLDAAQERLEREVVRLINRKRALPEMSDYQRIVQMAEGVDVSLAQLVQALGAMGKSWSIM